MSTTLHERVSFGRSGVSRRRFLHTVSTASVAAGTLGFRDLLSLQAEELRREGRSMIVLWMQGAPSQFETFDPKPGTETGGPTEAIGTSVPGISVAQHWPETAQVMEHLALIRSMTNKEGNHRRATYQLHTGYAPSGSVKHPSLAANVAQEIGDPQSDLPSIVSMGPTVGAGFLGVDYEPFVVSRPGQLPDNVSLPVDTPRFQRRQGLLSQLDAEFARKGGEQVVNDQGRIYRKASRMVLSSDVKAFDISQEPESLREAYGDNNFGRGCLLARRLVEAGVTAVEVRHGNWDTHFDNFDRTKGLSETVDPGFATLIRDLHDRGLLEKTLVVWMGEFGRTPRINGRTGRDHYPRVFNAVMAGGGVRGGQAVGSSTKDGSAIAERPVTVPDLFCSICHALRVDPRKENLSPLGRPMKIVDGGEVVQPLFS